MKKKSKVTRLDIEGEMNIFTAAVLRERLLVSLAAGTEVEVDLSKVSDVDSAGLQLMLAAKRQADAGKQALRFTGHSAAVVDVLDLCDLASHFGDPVLLHSRT